MQLRDRKKTGHGDKRAARSSSVEVISDDSSADVGIAVASKSTGRISAPGKTRKSKRLGAILKVVQEGVDPVTDDDFESAPARKRVKKATELRRSGRVSKVDYKEVASSDDDAGSSDNEDEDEVSTVSVVADADLGIEIVTSGSDSEEVSDRKTAVRKRVVRFQDQEEAGGSRRNGRPKRTCNATATAKSEVHQPKTTSSKPTVDQSEESASAVIYGVGVHGLEVDGQSRPVVKMIKQQIEKVLAVNRSNGSSVFCVKERNKSYRSAINVTEHVLEKFCPQLMRNFMKRLDALGRTDGHTGTLAEGPAFDPRYLIVERIIAAEHRGRTRKLYVKWKGLPYTDATWEPEEAMMVERTALTKFKASSQHPCDISSGFKDGRSLRDYQMDGVKWLDCNFRLKVNCILADEMGLGKTIQAVAMLENLRCKRKSKGPFLIIAPVSTLGHWQREVESLTDMNCVVYTGTQEDRAIIQEYEFWIPRTSSPKFTVLLSSFEILLKDRTCLGKVAWKYIIVDEAHRLKSRESKTSSALSCMNVEPGGLLLLTGTPIQNNTKELFSLLSFLDPDEFDSEEDFMNKYGNIKDFEQIKDLQENILRPRLLRRMKEDVEKSIPLKEETIIWVELTKEQRTYYRAIYENRVADLLRGSHSSSLPNLRNMAMELRKLCNHPFLCDGLEEDFDSKYSKTTNISNLVLSSGKMVLLDKLLPMLHDAKRRVLLFSQFTIMLDILEDYLSSRGYTFERIDGKIRGSDRQAAIDRYSANDSQTFIFLLSTRAGGVGITLTAADTCIIYDSDWNPQNDLQAMARCHRIGQTKDVKVYRLITKNTYEQHLFECSSRKYGLDEAVLGKIEYDQPDSNKNIESLLRHGAYEILKDDGEAEAAAFRSENINHILEQRTQKRMIGGRGNNTFSVATFAANEEPILDAEVKPEDFWRDVLPEACGRNAETRKKNVIGPRKRRKVDYVEDGQSSDASSGDDPSEEGNSPDKIKKDGLLVEDLDQLWTVQELTRLVHSLSMYGTLQPKDAMLKAGLDDRGISEVQEVIQAIVQLCHHFQAKEFDENDDSIIHPVLPSSAETAMKSSAFRSRLEKNAKKYLQIFHERKVIANAIEHCQSIGLPRSVKLPIWWGETQDRDLLKGIHCHGHRAFKYIRTDPSLCFAATYEDCEASGDWPSDAVLSGRVKKLVKLLQNVTSQIDMSLGERSSPIVVLESVLKQSNRHKRVLSGKPDDVEPPMVLVPHSDPVHNEGEGKRRRKVRTIKFPSPKKAKVFKSDTNKENQTPSGSKTTKISNSTGKQKSLLGYFQPLES